jgi:hypothetical protein
LKVNHFRTQATIATFLALLRANNGSSVAFKTGL